MANANRGNQRVAQVSGAIQAITASAGQVKALVDAVSTASREQAQGIPSAEKSAAASEELSAQSETSMEVVGQLSALVGSSTRQAA